MSADLHPANDHEAAAAWSSIGHAHIFDSANEYESYRATAPWRVQVTGRGETAVIERWRNHLDILAVKGLWCAPARIASLMDGVASVAAAQGYGRVLSPLVPTEMRPFYEKAGMELAETIVVLRRAGVPRAEAPGEVPAGVRLRRALPEDLDALVALDAACFDEFWRYDAQRLARNLAEDRLMVAVKGAHVIGYTLATLVGDTATLGRLSVVPSERGRGVGVALLSEALAYLGRASAGPVSLCTQEENRVSRSLYAAAGLRELPGRLHFLMRSVDGD